jgi:hypothetical protein
MEGIWEASRQATMGVLKSAGETREVVMQAPTGECLKWCLRDPWTHPAHVMFQAGRR